MADSYYVIGPDDLSEKGKTSRSGVITLFAKRLCEKKGIDDPNKAFIEFKEFVGIDINENKYFDVNSFGKNDKEIVKGKIHFPGNIWYDENSPRESGRIWKALKEKLTKSNDYVIISDDNSGNSNTNLFDNSFIQIIYYGAPGTGKSYKINEKLKGKIVYRTTFHPDTDYATFVGCYKPDMDSNNNIIYSFIPQIFIKAYLRAWVEYIKGTGPTNTPSQPNEEKADLDKEGKEYNHVYLVIEEINRGGCAQIFGDLFLLFDREDEGWSQYVIIPDQDIAKYLDKSAFPNNPKLFDNYKKCIKKHYEERDKNKKSVFKVIIDDNETYLALPPNFHIWATMNTSDQSLFPMDSAFKRRWDWEYVPINPDHEKVKGLKILLNNHEYEYPDFLNKVNSYIKSLHNSADKQIGEFFVKSKDDVHISFKDFRDKILFYLFNDVFKDNKKFREEFNDGNFLFEDLYIKDEIRQKDIVSEWLDKLGVNHISTKQNQDETTQDSETDDTDNQNEL